MTTVGFIGSGHIGQAVAALAVRAGYDVVVSNSRGPETLGDVVAGLGTSARAATAEDAAAAGDIVVVTIPLKNYTQVPVEPLRGKLVLDTNNYYPQRDDQIAELDDGSATSSELLQRHLPESRVVKVFNNINYAAFDVLARPSGEVPRTALPIFGDDLAAKTGVTEFLDTIGFDAVDGGSLSDSWRAEPGTPVYGMPYATDGDWSIPQPADAATIRALLEQATR